MTDKKQITQKNEESLFEFSEEELSEIQAFHDNELSESESEALITLMKEHPDSKAVKELLSVDSWWNQKVEGWEPEEIPELPLDQFYLRLEKSNAQSNEAKQPFLEQKSASKTDLLGSFIDWLWPMAWGTSFVMVFMIFFVDSGMKLDPIEHPRFLGKGTDFRLVYARKHGDVGFYKSKSIPATKTVHLSSGDLVQFYYDLPKKGLYLTILGFSEQGQAFTVLKSQILSKKKGTYPKGSSLTLDEYLGKELYVLFFTKKPVHLKKAKHIWMQEWTKKGQSLKKLKSFSSPWNTASFLIEKVTHK